MAEKEIGEDESLKTIAGFLADYYSELSEHNHYRNHIKFWIDSQVSNKIKRTDLDAKVYIIFGAQKKFPPSGIAYEEYVDKIPLNLLYLADAIGFANVWLRKKYPDLEYSIEFVMEQREMIGKRFKGNSHISKEEAMCFYQYLKSKLPMELPEKKIITEQHHGIQGICTFYFIISRPNKSSLSFCPLICFFRRSMQSCHLLKQKSCRQFLLPASRSAQQLLL